MTQHQWYENKYIWVNIYFNYFQSKASQQMTMVEATLHTKTLTRSMWKRVCININHDADCHVHEYLLHTCHVKSQLASVYSRAIKKTLYKSRPNYYYYYYYYYCYYYCYYYYYFNYISLCYVVGLIVISVAALIAGVIGLGILSLIAWHWLHHTGLSPRVLPDFPNTYQLLYI